MWPGSPSDRILKSTSTFSLRNKKKLRPKEVMWLGWYSTIPRLYFWPLVFFFWDPIPFRVTLHGGGDANRTCVPFSLTKWAIWDKDSDSICTNCFYPYNGSNVCCTNYPLWGEGSLIETVGRIWKRKPTLNTSDRHYFIGISFFSVNWKQLKVTFLS